MGRWRGLRTRERIVKGLMKEQGRVEMLVGKRPNLYHPKG